MSTAIQLGRTNRRLDLDAVGQGVEKECPFREGLFVTILPGLAFNDRYHRAMIALSERSAADAPTDDADVAAENRIRHRFMDPGFVVDALVADMRGLYDADGEEVAYTREVGLEVLSDPAHADVLHWIGNEAHDYGRYYTDRLLGDAGNSPNGSSGNEAGAGDSEKTRR